METMKRIGIWIRVSTDFQVKDESPEHHEQRARYYAEAKGWEVVEIYRLDAVSGKSIMQHHEAKRMLNHVKSGHITGIIFSKLARLARNTKELLEISDIFRSYNADLISLQESIDTSTPAGRLFYTMIAAMAQWEREEIAERVSASVPVRAKMGKPLGGQGSYGYRWVGNELTVDESEAPVRQLLYELFAKHKRKITVANLLNGKGYRTRNGSRFSGTTVHRLLRDPSAKGKRIANHTKSLGEKKSWKQKPQDEWIIVPCQAIVSESLWDECNNILDEQERTRKPLNRRPSHLFTAILYCECGAKMYVPSNSKKYICLSCRKNRIDINDLEEVFYENLRSYLANEEYVKKFISQTSQRIKAKEIELEQAREKKLLLEKEMDKLIELYQAGQIPKQGFSKYYNPIHEQVTQLEENLAQMQGQIDFLKVEYINSDKISQDAMSLYNQWPDMSQEDKRSIVEAITKQITIGKNGIHFKFYFPPATPFNSQQFPNATSRIHRSDQHKRSRKVHRYFCS